MVKIDLHIHSTYSDGKLSPKELVDKAFERNISAIAITDHDSAKGNEEAMRYAKQKGIDYIQGIEITITPPEFCKELHIVGLFIDPRNKEIIEIKQRHKKYAKGVIKEIIKKLKRLGYEIDLKELEKETKGKRFGRPYLADQLVKRYPGEFSDQKEVFNKLLGRNGKAFVRPKGTKMKKAIEIIHRAGGIAIVAHPWYLDECMEKVIEEFSHLGGDGIERDYPEKESIPADIGERLDRLIEKYSLVVSGGTDFHDINSSKNKDLGDRGLTKEEFEKLKRFARSKKKLINIMK